MFLLMRHTHDMARRNYTATDRLGTQLYVPGVLTMSHCSTLRVKAAVRMYGPRLPNDVTLLGFACEGCVPFYVPCRVVATLQCSALRVKAAIHLCVPRLLATSHCVGSRRSILCAPLPDDVTLLGSVCEGSESILCASPARDATQLDSVCKCHRSSLSATRYGSLPLATLIRKRFYIKRHLAVSPT